MNSNDIKKEMYKSLINFVSGGNMILASENQTLFRIQCSSLYIYHIRYNKVTKTKISVVINPEAEGIVVNCKIYFIGGGFPSTNTNIAIVYSATITKKEPMPTKQYGVALTKHNGTIYCLGGTNSMLIMNNYYAFSITHNSWKIRTPLPHEVKYACACIVSQTLYLIGGFKNDLVFHTPLSEDKWASFNLPESVCFMKCIVMDSNILIIGSNKAILMDVDPKSKRYTARNIAMRYKFKKLVSPIIQNKQNLYFMNQDGFIYSYTHSNNELKKVANCDE